MSWKREKASSRTLIQTVTSGLQWRRASVTITYHNLSDLQFEELVIEFCAELLGNGVQGFVTGPDGGRDARFSGTAMLVPSETDPWSGKIVIQAKHTELLNKAFS